MDLYSSTIKWTVAEKNGRVFANGTNYVNRRNHKKMVSVFILSLPFEFVKIRTKCNTLRSENALHVITLHTYIYKVTKD
jgi:hypothetical protein